MACQLVLCYACGAVEDTWMDLEEVYDAAAAAGELPIRLGRWCVVSCHFVGCCACGAVEDTWQVYDAAAAAEKLPVR
jgi:translation initiation factor 2 beta subunit (eIF-2beta)/eIF-5